MLHLLYTILLCYSTSIYATDTETLWHHVDQTSYKILKCHHRDQNIKLKVIGENDNECLISFIAEFNHASDSDFHLQAILLDSDGFEIIRRPLADCAKNEIPPKGKMAKLVEPVHSHYNIKGSFSVPCGFFERTKDVELRFYKN